MVISFDTQIGKKFKFGELILYRDDNIPDEESLIKLTQLTCNILDPIRAEFGVVNITSGYRNAKYNKLAGGAVNSQHTKGEAVDFVVEPNKVYKTLISHAPDPEQFFLWKVYKWCLDNLEFDQIIYEDNGKSKWIHISYNITKNRKEALLYKDGNYSYYKEDNHGN